MLYINQANEIALRQIELRRSANAPTSPPQTKKKESADTDEVLSSTSTPRATRACVRGLMGFHARTQLGSPQLFALGEIALPSWHHARVSHQDRL